MMSRDRHESHAFKKKDGNFGNLKQTSLEKL